jgi:translation initiation factor 1
MSKKNNLGGFVFSTNKSFEFEIEETDLETPDKQKLEVHLVRHKGDKITTLVKGFQGKDQDLKELGKALKMKCGVGGTVKDNEILIQGNFRDKVMEYLKVQGHQVKRVGG